MDRPNSFRFLKPLFQSMKDPRVISIDLETLIDSQQDFLNDERIIAISLSYSVPSPRTEVFVAKDESEMSERDILNKMDNFLGSYQPNVIIGYNQTGYDIPLIQTKLRKLSYADQLWNFKYYSGTSIIIDMMYIIAEDLEAEGDFKLRKLRDVVSHPRYAHLNLNRKKDNVIIEGMNVGQAIRHLWKNDPVKFLEYCKGDTEDVLNIFYYLFYRQII
ncbi:MAG: 3'-5' exonuclease [Thermoplasmataceae archaeon]